MHHTYGRLGTDLHKVQCTITVRFGKLMVESDSGVILMVRSISGGGEIRLKCIDGHVNGVMFMEKMLMTMVS